MIIWIQRNTYGTSYDLLIGQQLQHNVHFLHQKWILIAIMARRRFMNPSGQNNSVSQM